MTDILLFTTLVAVAAFIQTVSGFAFGLICMAGVGALGILPIHQAALLVSALTLVNIFFALPGRFGSVRWSAVATILLSGIPAIALGLWLLQALSTNSVAGLRIVLGASIALCCLMMLRGPSSGQHRAPASGGKLAQLGAGLFGGLLGGMFSTFGPPVIYLLYRQHWEVQALRATLLALFLVTNTVRTSMALGTNWPDPSTWLLFLGAAPAVVLVTLLSRGVNLPSLRIPVMVVLALASASMIVTGIGAL